MHTKILKKILHNYLVIIGLLIFNSSFAAGEVENCNYDYSLTLNVPSELCYAERNNINLNIEIQNLANDSLHNANIGWFVANDNQDVFLLEDGIEPSGFKTISVSQVSFPHEGTYTLYVYVNSSCNGNVIYGDTVSVQIIIRSQFSITLPIDTNKCVGSGVPLTLPDGLGTYLWSSGDTLNDVLAIASGPYSVTVTDAFGCQAIDTINVSDFAAPGGLVGDTVLCDGIILTADVGTGFTNYLWSNGMNSSSIQITESGLYAITVTDTNGCEYSDSMNVSYAQVPTPGAPSSITICAGDTTIIAASNNFSTYFWSTGDTTNSIPIFVSGIYMITVVGNSGCIGIDTVTVNVTPLPPIVFSDSVICNNNPYVLDVGQWFPSVQWSTGDTTQNILVSSPGMYTVSVTDLNGCHSIDTLNIVNVNVSVNLGADDTVCIGSSTSLVPSGVFDTYLWSTGSTSNFVTPSSSGIYSVTVTKDVCYAIDEVMIEVESQPTADFITQVASPDVQFTNLSTYMYDVHWDFGDNFFSSQIDPLHSYTGNGTYTVILEVRNTCDTVYKSMDIGIFPQGANNIILNNELRIFPTLATYQIQFTLDIENYKNIEYTVYDVVGKLLYHKEEGYFGPDYLYQINISSYASGTYYLKIKSDSQPIAISPFVKQ